MKYKKSILWGNVKEMLSEGQKMFNMRNETKTHPSNKIVISDVNLYIAEVKNPEHDHSRFVAYLESNEKQVEIIWGRSRAEVKDNVVFSVNFATCAPSTWYRRFRTLHGFSA